MPPAPCPKTPSGKHRWITLPAGEVCEACHAVRMPGSGDGKRSPNRAPKRRPKP